MYGRISFGPSAQFNPTIERLACAMDVRNASTVCPPSIRPERSVTVPETIRGTLPRFLKGFRDREERGLGIERIENGFDQQKIDTAFEQSKHLVAIRLPDLIEGDRAEAGSFTSGEIEQ